MCEMFCHGVEGNAIPIFLSGRLIRLTAFGIMLYRGSYESVVSAVVCTCSYLFLNNNKANTPSIPK